MTKDELFELIDLKVEGLRNKAILKDAVEDYTEALIAAKPIVIRRLFDVTYHSNWGVPFINTASFLACDEADALTQFWDGKNKEQYEVTLVMPRINGV